MEHQANQNLKLVVSNPTQVASGSTREHIFGVAGGSIGSAESDTWRLSSHRTGAGHGHAEVRFVDGVFCLIDRSGRTYINSATQPVGRGRRARLKSGDVITVGRYQLRAEVFDDEPMQELTPAPGEAISEDPMQAWRTVDQGQGSVQGQEATSTAVVTDEYRENRDVAIGLPIRQGGKDRMCENRSSAAETESQDQSRNHISSAPLMRGMESHLPFEDSDDLRLFLEEAGQTLKATVEGLLELHQGEDSRHQALRTRLQPIEDNPLRLGGDYSDTVQTLFASQRSPVHLSAPAAVSESLRSLHHHQLATRAAISEGLDAILHAFSPQALLRRFHGYRRGLKTDEPEGSWAWEMYRHYYQELSSSRQQGFERLFQEVFDQAYDQQLRQLQREDLS
jgi:type VI secretion system protein ImpI